MVDSDQTGTLQPPTCLLLSSLLVLKRGFVDHCSAGQKLSFCETKSNDG